MGGVLWSACMYLFVCTIAYLNNHSSKFRQRYCTCYPWLLLDAALTAVQHVMMMMMMSRFIKRVINSPQTRSLGRPNRWAFRCPANVKGERVAVRRVSGRLFQVTGPATAKLLIPSVVLVLGTKSSPVPADRRCRLPAIVEIARQSYFRFSGWRHVFT